MLHAEALLEMTRLGEGCALSLISAYCVMLCAQHALWSLDASYALVACAYVLLSCGACTVPSATLVFLASSQ